jgi:hypothetical protein
MPLLLAMGGLCVVAAGVGGYVAQSQRQVEVPTIEARPAVPAPTKPARPKAPAAAETIPVAADPRPALSEAAASPLPPVESRPVARVAVAAPVPAHARETEPVEKPKPAPKPSEVTSPRTARVAAAAAPPLQASVPPTRTADPAPAVEMPVPDAPVVAEAPPPVSSPPIEPAAKPQGTRATITETFVVPADSVVGLELEQSVSSETAQVEDRVDARVARDVKIDGTTVIPAGSRVRGEVIRVENGGRFKDRARIEIRFHTLVLGDGDTQSIATDPLFREGDNVGRKAGARIGASAAGGAIIGAIFGGEKGAAIGAAAGAGAGTAVTATQKPSEARFRAGSVVTVRLTAPVSITVQQ